MIENLWFICHLNVHLRQTRPTSRQREGGRGKRPRESQRQSPSVLYAVLAARVLPSCAFVYLFIIYYVVSAQSAEPRFLLLRAGAGLTVSTVTALHCLLACTCAACGLCLHDACGHEHEIMPSRPPLENSSKEPGSQAGHVACFLIFHISYL